MSHRRETLLVLLVGLALLYGAWFLTRARPDDPDAGTPSGPGTVAPRDRSAHARPEDPALATALRGSRSLPATRAGADPDRTQAPLVVHVVDAAGQPRSGIPVDLRDSDPRLGPSALLVPPAVSGADGRVSFRWPDGCRATRGFVSVAILSPEPAFQEFERAGQGAVVLKTPDLGAVEVDLVLASGKPWTGDTVVRVLIAPNDPPADALVQARMTQRAAGGRARFPLVATGSLLCVEASPAATAMGRSWRLVEGPRDEGSTVRTTLVVTEKGPVPATRREPPLVLAPAFGPASHGSGPGPGCGQIEVRARHIDLLPAWPDVVVVGLAPRPAGRPEADARLSDSGRCSLSAAPGAWHVVVWLYRAHPDGWEAVRVDAPERGWPKVEVRPQGIPRIDLDLDPAALAAAAAALAH